MVTLPHDLKPLPRKRAAEGSLRSSGVPTGVPLAGERGWGEGVNRQRFSQSGFTYLGILFAIAIMGAVLGATGMVWKTVSQRDKETELLAIGHEFRRAIGLYYDNTPGTAKQYPKKLDDLLEDKRYPTLRRYLRKVYVDPLTSKKEWGIVPGPVGTITGVYSLSTARPIKTANFDEADKEFEGALNFQAWAFSHKPSGPAQTVVPAPVAKPLTGLAPATPPATAPATPSATAPLAPDAQTAAQDAQ